MEITLGSLFDGIGVFPLAAYKHGITPLWASEIEKASISITKRHFPRMEHVGNITKLTGRELPSVHVITFGSPCQNLSTIGYHDGIYGKKSSLFFEAIRIIKEMRASTNGRYPVIIVWENVMGAFSSNHRMDFKTILQSFADTEIPMPASGAWANAGMVRGERVDLCWRVLDAQYWESPRLLQRRKRIFLVADFRGTCAAEILFKSPSMFKDFKVISHSRLFPTQTCRKNLTQTGWKLPIVQPFQERRMRSAAKERNTASFLKSFGGANESFPTLLAKSKQIVAFWEKGREGDGVIRYLTPLECERLMGLPENWTAQGYNGEMISDNTRYMVIGNAIALPCAEYIMTGIKAVL